jgi:hemolysin activation/secretion protein
MTWIAGPDRRHTAAFTPPVMSTFPRFYAYLLCGWIVPFCEPASAEEPAPAADQAPAAAPTGMKPKPMFIQEYRVTGSSLLSQAEIGEIVYPFLGPERTADDVEQARAALEKAYKDKGFQTVGVDFPAQQPRRGVIWLSVTETKVGRLRVKGGRFFSLEEIKRKAPSLAEGVVPNFNDVTRDLVALNTLRDRHITPTVRSGVMPGTVDVDLNVKDTFPFHGSVELNNRASPDTTDLRLNASLSYDNLWQRGHSIGASAQISPQDRGEVKVYSGYYTARFADAEWLNLTVSGTKQDSNVSTLGGAAVAGRGEIIGIRANITLPPRKDFSHSLNFGLDYKNFQQLVDLGGDLLLETPTTYYPLNATYTATWLGKQSTTDLSAGLTFNVRGTGEDRAEFENSRYRADSNFIYLRGELEHTHELPAGFQASGKVQGQVSDQPLLSSEQLSGGGLGTVRGYLEAEVVGDNGVFGSLELRSPSLAGWLGDKAGEWRIYGFVEGGALTLRDALPDQTSNFTLASVGVGSRLRLLDHFGSSVDLGIPLVSQTRTQAHDPHVTFRMWADF